MTRYFAAIIVCFLLIAGLSGSAAVAGIPPGEADAKAALERSPRHGEWVDVAIPEDKPVRAWVVYPERKDKAPVVVVIHEIFGLTDWVRAVADQLAADGFLAIAPDLLSGLGPGGGGTEAFASRDDVVGAVRALSREKAASRLSAVRKHGLALPSAAKRSATIGFCWGGAQSFSYAAAQPKLDAAAVYYGSAPEDPLLLKNVSAPILGLYGGDDARVTATVPETEKQMKRLGKPYTAHVFEGAGHGFLRDQAGREGANRKAAEKAWPLTVTYLRQHLDR